MSSSDHCGVLVISGFSGGVSMVELNRWPGLVVADRFSGYKSAWQIGVEALGGRDSNRYGWVNRFYRYFSHLFQPKISRCWTWVVVSWSFLGLWFGGCVNFVEIFGFLGGCLLVVSGFVVSRFSGRDLSTTKMPPLNLEITETPQ